MKHSLTGKLLLPVRGAGLPVLLALVGALAAPIHSLGAQPSDLAADSKPRQTLYYIPHTHWEGAVFKTREDYLTMGMPRLLQVLRLLKEYPEYKFTLDQ